MLKHENSRVNYRLRRQMEALGDSFGNALLSTFNGHYMLMAQVLSLISLQKD